MTHPNPLQPRAIGLAVLCGIQLALMTAWILGKINWPWYLVTLPTWGAFGVLFVTHLILVIDELIEHYTRIR